MINGRPETLSTRNAYKAALAPRRCIIPADAFYEWQVREGEGNKKHKLPYVIRHHDGSPLAFAGLWEFWRDRDDPEAEPLRSCVIITTEANKLLAPIHDRMPVILPPEAWSNWLDPTNDDINGLHKLLVPAPAKAFEACPVSTRVNNVRNDGPENAIPSVISTVNDEIGTVKADVTAAFNAANSADSAGSFGNPSSAPQPIPHLS
jgi:putative SOS response-associated peptidase YedK